MAAVAGVIADLAVNEMSAWDAKWRWWRTAEKFLQLSNMPVDVAVAAGDEPLSKRFGFRLTEFPNRRRHKFRTIQPRFKFW